MGPEQLAAAAWADGSFVRISDAHLDVPLFWQCWKLDSPMIKDVTEAVQFSRGKSQPTPHIVALGRDCLGATLPGRVVI